MRHLLLTLLAFLAVLGGARAQTLLRQESFETDGEGTRYTSTTFDRRNESPTPFTAQYFLREDNPVQSATGQQTFGTTASPVTIGNVTGNTGTVPVTPVPASYPAGTFFWACEGARGQGTVLRPAPTVTLNPVTVTGYSSLKVQVALADARGSGSPLAAAQWENDDYVRVQVRQNGTGAWTTVGQFVGDNSAANTPGNLRRDTNLDGISYNESSATLSVSLTDFTFDVSGTATTLEVRVEVDANGGTEELAFDNIRVLGTISATQPPVLANIESSNLTYNEGDPATLITSAVTVGDQDSPTLTGATVSLTTGFITGQDQLLFTNQNGISGSYNPSTGVLTLTGSALLANYQTALRSVRYQNTQTVTAVGGLRLANFQVSDGTNASNTQSRYINVVAQLNAPAALPYVEDFETSGEGLRYASNAWEGSGVCLGFLRVSTNPYACSPVTFGNVSNTSYWYSEGTSNPANPNTVDIGTFVLAPVNASAYRDLRFSIRLATGQALQWENDDYFKVFYRVNNGSWTLFGAFYGNGTPSVPGELQRDLNLDGVADGTGTILGPTMQAIDFIVPAGANEGSAVDFMIEINSDGQEELAFDRISVTGTQIVLPTVTTAAASNVAPTTATLGGNVTADGGGTITERGVVYVQGTGTPTTSNTKLTATGTTGGFTVSATGLTASTQYTVRAYAINSQGTSYGSNVAFTTLAPVSGTTVVTNVACRGGNTGAINLTPTGGVAPYTFNWGGGVTTEDRTNLVAGTYTVTITDVNGNTGTVSATVNQPASGPGGTTVVTNVACFGGNTGAINLTPTGGTGPYTFNWVGGITTEDRTNLTEGTYTVTITDANGCTGTVSATVTQPATAISGTTVVTNVACFGGSTGAINLTPSGGTGPYTFNWGGGVTTEDRTNLVAGTYTVTITDANGCTGTVNATVTQPAAALTVTPNSQTNIACFGGNNGRVQVAVSGGTTPYTYDWTPGNPIGDGTASVSNLSAGTYTVTVTDARGCTATRNFTITQPSALATTGSQTDVTTFGGSNGTATVTVSGGTPSYTYLWSPSPGGGQGTATATGLTARTYTVTATDANSCTIQRSFTITQPTQAPVIFAPANGQTISSTTPTYAGTAVPNATVTVYVDGAALGSTATANASGNWTLTQPTPLSSGSHQVYATAQASGAAVSANSATNTFTVQNPATYTSSTADQPNTGRVAADSQNQEILRVAITIGGGPDLPLNAQSFSFTTNGSTDPADITAARVFYTGTSGTLSTTNQFGSTVANPNGSFTVTGAQQLTTGTNYFFLVYDVAANAATNNLLDATVPSLTISGTAYTPSVTSPTGSRRIIRTERVAGNALRFNGTSNGYVDLGASFPTLGAQYTQELWVKPLAASGNVMRGVLGYDPGNPNNRSPFVAISENNEVQIGFGTGSSLVSYTSPNNTVVQNQWNHVVATFGGGNLRLYVNGVLINTQSTGGATPILTTAPRFVGKLNANTATAYFNGDIDEVAQWNSALTLDDIRLRRHLVLSGVEAGLVSYLQFNEGSGNVLDPVSGASAPLTGTGVARATSTAPVGYGTSARQTINANGTATFAGTNTALNFSSVSGSFDVTVARLDGLPQGTQPSGLAHYYTPAYWIINKYGTGNFGNAAVTYTLGATDISAADAGSPATTLRLLKRASNSDGAFDTPIPAVAASASGTVTFNVTSFSQTVIGTLGTSPLPVELKSFTAERVGEDGLLRWTTAQEKNNAYFEVESSADGQQFRSIGRVTGNGTSTVAREYQLTDRNLSRYGRSVVYYRLRQVDQDGTEHESAIVTLAVPQQELTAEVFPNPAADQLTIRVAGLGAAKVQAQLYDAQGRLVQRLTQAVTNGSDIQASVKELPNGVYTLRLLLPDRVLHRSIVVQH
ncbi:T9SS type A sorting domain-containing protein [Hymenobacter gummosus]|uniref:T9SS type A sorting domain-containing protein n=1 Tax=Hymenobacter gummosus TaxID=1776032 RepID=A0A3S0JC21_9BACT|nr:LamG-like jellyroll fold domain-containing protein [Hymenobacter gummosus]RTQ47180.1 T9SS type A sorting domain-containing protein [Hymenobacter gummosus]